MSRYINGAALVACLCLALAFLWVKGQRDAGRVELARLEREIAIADLRAQQAEDAAAVHKAWLERSQADAAAAAQTENEFTQGGEGHAPLSGYLSRALDRVRQ